MEYAAVEFEEEKSCAVVPITWVLNNEYCYWPNSSVTQKQFRQMVEIFSPPSQKWNKYKIKLVHFTSSNLEDAETRLNILVELSTNSEGNVEATTLHLRELKDNDTITDANNCCIEERNEADLSTEEMLIENSDYSHSGRVDCSQRRIRYPKSKDNESDVSPDVEQYDAMKQSAAKQQSKKKWEKVETILSQSAAENGVNIPRERQSSSDSNEHGVAFVHKKSLHKKKRRRNEYSSWDGDTTNKRKSTHKAAPSNEGSFVTKIGRSNQKKRSQYNELSSSDEHNSAYQKSSQKQHKLSTDLLNKTCPETPTTYRSRSPSQFHHSYVPQDCVTPIITNTSNGTPITANMYEKSSCLSTPSRFTPSSFVQMTSTPSNSQNISDQAFKTKMVQSVERIIAVLDQHSMQITEIKRLLNNNTTKTADRPKDFPVLPLEKKAHFNEFERNLGNKEIYNFLKNRLACLGGSGVRGTTTNMIKYVLTDRVARKFNWTGHNEKLAFKSTKLLDVIKEAVYLAFQPAGTEGRPSDLNDVTIVTAIKDWLRLSNQRFINKNKTKYN